MEPPVPSGGRRISGPRQESSSSAALRAVKFAHTAAWALFAGCIVALPFAAWHGRYSLAWLLIAIVGVEVLVLLLNRLRCPLTNIAERYTDDRRPNFDIYLPQYVARYNKEIFGPLFALGIIFTVILWRLDGSPGLLPGAHCESEGPLALRPHSYDQIRVGMSRAEVERILGPPDYSPIEGQDYFSTGGDCEIAPGRTASCGFIIVENAGRIVECRWGGIGE